MISVRIERKGLRFVHVSIQQRSCPDFLTGSIEAFQEVVKPGSLSFVASLNAHLWLLSAATLPTNLEPSSAHVVNSNFPTQFLCVIYKIPENKSEDYLFSPFSKIINFVRHFEEDISSKSPFYVSTSGTFTFIEITVAIFPNENPETKFHFKNSNKMKLEFGIMLPNYQFLLLPLERSRAPPP